MALDAVIYQQDMFVHTTNWSYDHLTLLERDQDHKPLHSFDNFLENQTENFLHSNDHWSNNTTSTSPPSNIFPLHFNEMLQINNGLIASTSTITTPNTQAASDVLVDHQSSAIPAAARAKRRRARSKKNKEEIENQRQTHIAVERNRRKQMNDYLSVLRSLMPESYVQRGDQASIIGGAINFVKELEQHLQLLGGHKEIKQKSDGDDDNVPSKPQPFSEFFTFPQYSTRSDNSVAGVNESMSSVTQSAIADVEVTIVESHANLKIRSKRRPKQLLKIVSGLHIMRLTILHLNVTTIEQIVLYSLSLKVEDDCKLNSVDEIAAEVYEMLGRIEEEYSMM